MFTKQDYRRKIAETDTHVYFVGGPLSQWSYSPFEAKVRGLEGLYEFNRAEQHMMASKAALFNDMEIFEAIMASTSASEQKVLGRKVRNFDLALWNANARDIVFETSIAKYTQSQEHREFLLDYTGDRYLVEGADYDNVWGVFLAWNDPLILDPANWKGTNWLGETLMRARTHLREIA